MTLDTIHAREAARDDAGRFGTQEHSAPETTLPSFDTYDIPVDELNRGDQVVYLLAPATVQATLVEDAHPETRIVVTDRGDIHLDREARVDVIRTGDEPRPEDHDDFHGYCHRCGGAFALTPHNTTFHIHPRGGQDYDADENHTSYSLDQFGEDL